MNSREQQLPLAQVTLVLGALSIPMAFAVHLVSLAVVLALLAVGFGAWGRIRARRHLLRYDRVSVRRALLGLRLGLVGMASAIVMWLLWATNILLQ